MQPYAAKDVTRIGECSPCRHASEDEARQCEESGDGHHEPPQATEISSCGGEDPKKDARPDAEDEVGDEGQPLASPPDEPPEEP